MAPRDQFSIQQNVAIGLNSLSAPDTAVAPTRLLLATSVEPSFAIQTEEFTPRGSKVPTLQNVNSDDSQANLSGKAEFHELGVFAASNLVGDDGTNTGVALAPVAGTVAGAWIWDFTPKVTDMDTPRALTMQFLGSQRGQQMGYALIAGMSLGVEARSGISFGGNVIGQQLRDSADGLTAFTLATGLTGFSSQVPLQVRGQENCTNVYLSTVSRAELGEFTTASLAHSANAAAITAALEALTNIGAGNVAVTGTGPFVVTFQGDLANTPMPKIKIASSTLVGGSLSVANTTEGTDSVNAVQTITVSGTLTAGNYTLSFAKTKLSRVRSSNWNTSGRWNGFYELDCDFASWSIPVEAQMQGGIDLTLGANQRSMRLLREIRAGQKVWVRTEILGPTIGVGPDRYSAIVDSCVFLKPPSGLQDIDGLVGVQFGGTFARDDNFGAVPGFTNIRLINTSATLLA